MSQQKTNFPDNKYQIKKNKIMTKQRKTKSSMINDPKVARWKIISQLKIFQGDMKGF
jgi:hypothetical protein